MIVQIPTLNRDSVSVYHLAKAMEEQQLPDTSNTGENSGIWSALWRLPIPNAKKKNFCGKPVMRFFLPR
jgi:hypothetical protein